MPTMATDEFYQLVKSLENVFPIPTPVKTVEMGTFNASTGKFTGKTSRVRYESAADMGPGHQGTVYSGDVKRVTTKVGNQYKIETIPSPRVNAVNVSLHFVITNAAGVPVKVSAAGISKVVPSGQNAVTVSAGRAFAVNWKIEAADHSHSDHIEFRRPAIVGVGAFTVPALPIALVYEPPCDTQKKNKASYTQARSIGTTTEFSLSTDTSTTKPGEAPMEFASVAQMRNIMGGVHDLVQTLPDSAYTTAAKTVVDALKAIFDGIGKAQGDLTITERQGTVTTRGGKAVFRVSEETTLDTDVNDGGPGIGDILCYLRNVRMMWIAGNQPPTLTLLDYQAIAMTNVTVLQSKLNDAAALAQLGLDPASASALLSLDPFVPNPQAVPPEDRFRSVTTYEMDGSMHNHLRYELDTTLANTQRTATSKYTCRVENYRPGFLSFMGIGVTEEKTISTSTTQTSVTETSSEEQVKAVLDLYSAPGDSPYSVEVYADTVFGSFAFRGVPTSAQPLVVGELVLANGQPVAQQSITLTVGGRVFTTFTDRSGRFAFRASTIPAGRGTIRSEGQVLDHVMVRRPGIRPDLHLQIKEARVPLHH